MRCTMFLRLVDERINTCIFLKKFFFKKYLADRDATQGWCLCCTRDSAARETRTVGPFCMLARVARDESCLQMCLLGLIKSLQMMMIMMIKMMMMMMRKMMMRKMSAEK